MLRFPLHVCYFAVLRGVVGFLHLASVRNIQLPDDDTHAFEEASPLNATGCKVTRTEIFYECTKELKKSTSNNQIDQDFSQLLKMRVDCRGASGFQNNFSLVDEWQAARPSCSSWVYKKYHVLGENLRRDPTLQWLPLLSGHPVTVWKDQGFVGRAVPCLSCFFGIGSAGCLVCFHGFLVSDAKICCFILFHHVSTKMLPA